VADIDLSGAIDSGAEALHAANADESSLPVHNYLYDSRLVIEAALPHILEALAVSIEMDAQLAPDNAPDFHERYLAEKNIPKVRAFTALIRAKAAEARA
jgi:hypothetical protein